MEKLWVYPEAADEKLVQHLSQQMNIHPIIAKFLIKMDIDTPEKVDEFFNPSLFKLLDPFLMRDMDKAVTRIRKAIEGKERILVYGDYDVDGTTAVSILHSFIANQPGVKMLPVEERQLEYRIPDRYSEGYGLNFEAVNFAKEHHFSLIITLDCGIRGNGEIELANQYGIDVIVGDHHRPGDELPNAFAILDPKIDGETYPYKDLSGAGIAFKIVEAYCKKYGIDEAKIYRYLDLCVMSIASDVVPITGENRILAYYGLKRINTKPRPAIEAILKHALIFRNQDPKSPIFFFDKPLFFDRELTINDLVFLIGPRINAAGRMESGKNAVRLLETEDDRLEDFSAEIEAYNNERKELDRKATDDAIEVLDRLAEDFHHQTQKTTVVFNEEWHKGIIGIVASRLVEKYFRPTIVFTKSNDMYTGSARSIKGFDIYEAIEKCENLIEHWGGHKYAAGLSIKPENYRAFKRKFEEVVSDMVNGEDFVPKVKIDAIINLSDITEEFFEMLEKFEPYGPRNLKPTFRTNNVIDFGTSRIVGDKHIKLSILQKGGSNQIFNGIAFKQFDKIDIVKNRAFDICYTLEKNEWKGKTNIQLNVIDIREAN